MRTAVSDLRPLRGLPLKRLYLDNAKVADLAPLKGMSLESLRINGTTVSDLSPLRGLPLTELRLTGCMDVTNLEALAGMKTLRTLILPPNPGNIEFLRGMTNMARIGFKYDSATRGPDKTAAEFWEDYGKESKL
jgi:hypothetical protein